MSADLNKLIDDLIAAAVSVGMVEPNCGMKLYAARQALASALDEMQDQLRLANIDFANEVRKNIDLRTHVTELEAAARPVRFNEREPEEGQRILLWLNDRFSPMWGYTVSIWDAAILKRPRPAGEYWLPMPPAPEVMNER